jgi:diguanylate cyclase (GGDEF)-like protein
VTFVLGDLAPKWNQAMSVLRRWPFKSLMLRPKLVMAFAGMAALAGLCGAIGLLFVNRIGTNVAVFSEVTSPLLTESMALVENARRMRSVFFRVVNGGDAGDRLAQTLADIHAESHGHLTALRRLAAQARIDIRLDEAEQRENEFTRTLEGMMGAHRREQVATSGTKDRWASFETQHRMLTDVLADRINRAESNMMRSGEEAKAQVLTGVATVDGLRKVLSDVLTEIYPVLQGLDKLQQQSERVDEAVKLLLAQSDPAALTTIEQQAATAFETTGSALNALAGRLRDAEGTAELVAILEIFGDIERVVLGPDGLFAWQRDALTASGEVAKGRETIDRIDRSYLEILDGVKRAVTDLNHQARQDAINGIVQGRSMISGSVLITILAALLFGLFFSRRIGNPLRRLTDHVAEIRQSGELTPLSDSAVAGRADEIGMLARSFNLLVAELADARQRLIAWSEAEVRKQYERLNAAINNMPQGLCMFDADLKLIICNDRYAEIYALPAKHTVAGTSLRSILEDHVATGTCPEHTDDYVQKRLAAVGQRKPYYFVNELRDGHAIAVSFQPMADGGSVTTHEDITERRQAEARIAYMAHHDSLTDLPNRVRFREQMVKALHRVERGETLAVLCLDLDDFKAVNDTLGHPIGDALLQAASDRLRTCVRTTDIVARLGGDEFAIVQTGVEQPVDSTALATRLIKAMSEPFEIEGHQLVVGASIGIAIAPNDGSDPDRLMKNADMALYRAKEDGRGIYRFFEPEMDAKMQIRRALELDLRKALALEEFEVFYQPLIMLETGEISGFEALLRWRHPQRGLVSPADFIPLAEEIGLIGPIGTWVLKQACIEAASWPLNVKIAVNVSPVQFKNCTVVLDVIAALGASGLSPHRLELEITEAVLLQDTDGTVSTLNQLRALGVRISMDDFGTGYSSLGYLRKFPFDKIKIDRSFIRDLSDKPDSVAIVRAVTGLSSALGISTTAEGVETQEQLQQLRDEGCTEVQGYLFSEAKPARDVHAMLQRFNPASKAVA